jgi:hypothetical protein
VRRQGGGAGTALDTADCDEHARHLAGWLGPGDDRHAGQLTRQVRGPVRPGEQPAGARGERRAQVGRARVVPHGQDRDAAARREIAEQVASDQRRDGVGGERGGESAGAELGDDRSPARQALDGMTERVGRARVVVRDHDYRRQLMNHAQCHVHPPGSSVIYGHNGLNGRTP